MKIFDVFLSVQAPGAARQPVIDAIIAIAGAATVVPSIGHCPPWAVENSDTVWCALDGSIVDWTLAFDRLEAARIEGNQDALFVKIQTPDGTRAGYWGVGELDAFKEALLPWVGRGEYLARFFDKHGCTP